MVEPVWQNDRVYIVGSILHGILWLFLAMLWIRFIFDWVQIFARRWRPSGPLLIALEGVYSTTDPPIKALRRVLPSPRIGNIALDLSFIVVLLSAWLLKVLVERVFFM